MKLEGCFMPGTSVHLLLPGPVGPSGCFEVGVVSHNLPLQTQRKFATSAANALIAAENAEVRRINAHAVDEVQKSGLFNGILVKCPVFLSSCNES